ncbi:DUF2397 family protein [Streptomyces sp. NPDC002788]
MTSRSAEPDQSAPPRPPPPQRSPRRPRTPPFAHLSAPNAALYRQVMGVFLAAKDRFAVHLRPEDVHAGLPPEHRPAGPEPGRQE